MTVSIILPYDFVVTSEAPELERLRLLIKNNAYYREYDQKYDVPADLLEIIAAEAVKQGSKKIQRAAEALLAYSQDDADLNMPCPNFFAFLGMFQIYLDRTYAHGWMYYQHQDGRTYPNAIDQIRYSDGSNRHGKTAGVYLYLTNFMYTSSKWQKSTKDYYFGPSDVTNRRIPNILAAHNLLTETPELRAAYDESLARFDEIVLNGFAQQYRVHGMTFDTGKSFSANIEAVHGRKVIHDTLATEYPARDAFVDHPVNEERIPVPLQPTVRVFDLKTHTFYVLHSDYLTPHVYNDNLGERLILPSDHRDLLDILTTDLDAFLGDVIEGKSAGNVVLSKGPPGVGKTLTAEVYAETTHKPLYSIHSGALGTDAESVHKRLTEIFKRAQRWNCVLLLDEADVFVMQRGGDIQLNAIVAEFLRALEYFDGLLFMTTNRPDDIDDAILSRCAAIIDFNRPDVENAHRIWKVQGENHGVDLPKKLIDELVAQYSQASGRDIKMLLRLALRVSKAKNVPLNMGIFRQCAMFRGVQVTRYG